MDETTKGQDTPETATSYEAATTAPVSEEPRRVWRKSLPKWSLWLSLAVLAWFALAAFGPKFGIIHWRTGLLFMIRQAGPYLLGIAAVFAVIALAFAFLKTPRGPWWKAAVGVAIPAVLFLGLASIGSKAESVPPIHDVSTDLLNPPEFSPATMTTRGELEANPINDYATPLGQIEMWANSEDEALKVKNHADIISESYPELKPIVLGNTTDEQAFDAIVAAMGEIGLKDVRRVSGMNSVEGVAETFAFGFKDDVVARVADGQIDIRSVSRVGVSDLGYNAARVEELSEAIRKRLGQ
ncbi:DUF1499 domain-containing protein [Qipengyuania sp. 6B39]|uniref:DUF1499 domain-containing protein n=1 Tax=Qipengyuania proteolytica TaxID=2867239 RepID=UPI001C89E7A8|nr:DUF1499 domain-containing protein [Qipengyuania proteolytica]MBX7496620.1 DUF1499 domain-containing protein [Qipengyuania proteolytica]